MLTRIVFAVRASTVNFIFAGELIWSARGQSKSHTSHWPKRDDLSKTLYPFFVELLLLINRGGRKIWRQIKYGY